MNADTRSTIAFDDFEARRNSSVGLLADRGTHVEPGMTNKIYSYADETHVHAVTGVTNGTNSDTYQYDLNGKTLALAARAGALPG